MKREHSTPQGVGAGEVTNRRPVPVQKKKKKQKTQKIKTLATKTLATNASEPQPSAAQPPKAKPSLIATMIRGWDRGSVLSAWAEPQLGLEFR